MTTNASAAAETSNRLPLQKPIILQKSSKSNVNEGGHDAILLTKHSSAPAQSKQQISKLDLVTMDTVRKKTKSSGKADLLGVRTPPPPAVARRNARERNRVKQVNNGFANLRQHIPNSIASTYESGRNGNKKLSKVETLRMAVEYIRSLEEMLNLSETNATAGTSENQPDTCYQSTNINYATSSSSSDDNDNISSTSTPPPSLQYVQINSVDGSSYHILPAHVFDNNEHLKVLPPNVVQGINFKSVQISSDNTNTSLSPEIYSDSSLSPATDGDMQAFMPVFDMEQLPSPLPTDDIDKDSIKSSDEMKILCRNLIMFQADADGELGKQLNMNELISW